MAVRERLLNTMNEENPPRNVTSKLNISYILVYGIFSRSRFFERILFNKNLIRETVSRTFLKNIRIIR